MRTCPGCPTVPVISRAVVYWLLRRIPEEQRKALMVKAMEWLTQRHEGLEIYAGICGRAYTDEEKRAIAQETGVVAELPCPFVANGAGCVLGPLPTRGRPPFGWLPTLMAAAGARPLMRELARQGAIADAKIALLARHEHFLTREAVKESRAESGI